MSKFYFERNITNMELSANQQIAFIDRLGNFDVSPVFGGTKSRSGLTVWPEWVARGSFAVCPLAALSRDSLPSGELVYAFSGGGRQRVRLYRAFASSVIEELSKWDNWRNGLPPTPIEPEEGQVEAQVEEAATGAPRKRVRRAGISGPAIMPKYWAEPDVYDHAGVIARAITKAEALSSPGKLLTSHEVSRHAHSIVVDDEGVWHAELSHSMEAVGTCVKHDGPSIWTVRKCEKPEEVPADLIEGFVEDPEWAYEN